MYPNTEFWELIKPLRLKHPNADLAKLTGYSKPYISAITKGEKKASVKFLEAVKIAISENKGEFRELGKPKDSSLNPIIERLSESVLKAVDSVQLIAQSNNRMSLILEQERSRSASEMPLTNEELMGRMLQLIAAAGVGGWKSQEEAYACISKAMFALDAGEIKGSMTAVTGKKHK